MSAIDQTVRVRASPQRIFQALTDADELMRWFPTRAESDPQTGGSLKLVWEFSAAEQNGSQDSKYLQISPNREIRYSWIAGKGKPPTTVTFTLTAMNGETEVHLVHQPFSDDAEGKQIYEQHSGPWSFYLANLKSYLEKGEDERTAKLGQKTLSAEKL